ncbi:N-methyltransferase fsqC [Cladobotryum mycophilum]|uniref:N-methyltransferase fsqC n=1 Tax=Cladobotryum mycophilum TaxID=491253 RepID=A0ABR0SVJ8_9HYPO
MRKTALLLRTLELQHKHVEYFALDVSRAALRSSIRELLLLFSGNSKTKIQGLLGTYEDCASWLQCKHDQKSRITLLWLGNSIANFTPAEASLLISRFFQAGQSPSPPIQMIIAEEITESYEGERSHDFVLNGLDAANQLLGTEVFGAADWDFYGRWNEDKCMHESFYVARRDLCLGIEGKTFSIKQRELVRAIGSGKWPYAKVSEICKGAGTQVVDRWSNQDESYGVYVLKGVTHIVNAI